MKYFQQVGPDVFGTKPIGTGPFKFVDWVKDSHVTMEANDSYWAGPPPMKTIVVKVIPEGVARMAALETGEVDFAINVPLDVIDRLQGNPNLQLFSRPSNRLFSLQFSTRNDTPIRNPKVRQALQYAIDTDGMIQALFKGRAVRLAGQLLSPSYFGYDPQRKATPYDPDKAKKLLADAGYPNGFDCVFKYSAGRYVQDKEVGQTIASQLAKVGVRVKQEVLESGTLITQLQTNQLNDMSLSGSMPPPDAYFMWSSWLSSSLYNYWSNQQFEALMDKSARTANRDERISLYKQCLDIFDQDPPGVPLYQPLEFYAASKKLSGFTPRAMQFLDLRTFKI
jgi:peptide/nickel transport system substrate-binding protein